MFQRFPMIGLIPILCCASCGSWRVDPPERPPLGVRDQVPLAASPYLAHLSRALDDKALIAGDLFADDLEFKSAPDPSRLLQGFARKKPPKDLARRIELRVLSYNVALYDPALYMEFYDSASPFL